MSAKSSPSVSAWGSFQVQAGSRVLFNPHG